MNINQEQYKTQAGNYRPGEVVSLRITGEKAVILSELIPEVDEKDIGRKFLVRTEEHKKKQVFACEIEIEGRY